MFSEVHFCNLHSVTGVKCFFLSIFIKKRGAPRTFALSFFEMCFANGHKHRGKVGPRQVKRGVGGWRLCRPGSWPAGWVPEPDEPGILATPGRRRALFIYFSNLRSLAPPIAPPPALITHGQPPRVCRRFRENPNSVSILACVFCKCIFATCTRSRE